MPISFLCDRKTINIPSNQPGFINFIVVPLYSAISEALPVVEQCINAAKNNVTKWQTYEETKEDEQTYHSRKSKVVIVKVPSLDDETSFSPNVVLKGSNRPIEKIEESSSESNSRSSSSDPSYHQAEGRPSDSNLTSSDKYLHKRNK